MSVWCLIGAKSEGCCQVSGGSLYLRIHAWCIIFYVDDPQFDSEVLDGLAYCSRDVGVGDDGIDICDVCYLAESAATEF